MITLICETSIVELLAHPFIEKLSDELWDGPVLVERNLMWFNSSLIAF